MSRLYSRRTFLRQTPFHFIKQYLQQYQINLGVPWSELASNDDAALNAALDRLPCEVLRRIDGDFSRVMAMASAKGVAAILEEASLWNQNWSDAFAAMSSEYERAMWTFLNEPVRFAAAGAFHEMDRLSFGWRRFVGLRLDPAVEEASLEQLGSGLAAHYRRQGRGRFCHVDMYRREEPARFCYFAYPEDAASTDMAYDEHGQFQRCSRQAAFEVIFVYRPEEGILDLYARGSKQEKESLAEIFCIHILGLAGLPEEGRLPAFDPSVLMDPSFTFVTDPQDRVQSVDVRLIRLDLPFDRAKGMGRRVTLEARSTPEAPNAMRALIDDALNPMNIQLADVLVGRAKLCFTFRPAGNARAKTLTFEVGYPDRCTLKDDLYDQIARKYLRRWGIARDDAAPILAAAG